MGWAPQDMTWDKLWWGGLDDGCGRPSNKINSFSFKNTVPTNIDISQGFFDHP